MGAYQQMGYQSHNLLVDAAFSKYAGLVASPVNYSEVELLEHVVPARFRRGFDVVFDPQLYLPSSERGRLREWSYFPKDVDTADLTSDDWWQTLVTKVCDAAARVKAQAVCSPAVIPRAFSDEYLERMVANGQLLQRQLRGLDDARALQTLIVSLSDLADPARAMTIASIASQTDCGEVYLVFVDETQPRRDLDDADELKGALRLIAALRQAGLLVFVAFSSSDVILWKAADATHCGTGKFFNLRRFTRSRFEEPADGGGSLPYWFEEALLAFLRTSDLQRVKNADIVSVASRSNPFAQAILEAIPNKKPWLALGWRQYLYWFADVQARIDSGEANVATMLQVAEENWQRLEEIRPQVLMDERFNNGSSLRRWRRALAEYPYDDEPLRDGRS